MENIWIRIRQNDEDPLDPDLDPQHWFKLCYLVRFLESRPVDLRNALLQANDEANRVKRRAAEEPVNCTWTIQAKLAACVSHIPLKDHPDDGFPIKCLYFFNWYSADHRRRSDKTQKRRQRSLLLVGGMEVIQFHAATLEFEEMDE